MIANIAKIAALVTVGVWAGLALADAGWGVPALIFACYAGLVAAWVVWPHKKMRHTNKKSYFSR